MLVSQSRALTFASEIIKWTFSINHKMEKEMLSDKELKYLEDLEKNQDVIYLLNTRECELIARLIRSYKDVRRQLTALQISKA